MIDHPHPPNCPGYSYDFTLEAPTPESGYCDNLAINGNLENGGDGTNRWYFNEYRRRFDVVKPGADGSKKALQSSSARSRVEAGLVTFVDTRCFDEVGKEYLVEARVKMPAGCNPYTVKSGNNRCVRANLRSRLNGWDLDYMWSVADTLETPFENDGWNTLFGYFIMTQDMLDADNMAFFFEGPNPGKTFVIDSLSVKEVELKCDPIVLNAGFEAADNRYWRSIGDNTKLTMVDNRAKYDTAGYSIKISGRSHVYHGISQLLHRKDFCLTVGEQYEVSAIYRLEDATTDEETDCDPLVKYSGLSSTCPVIGIKIQTSNGGEEYDHVGFPYGPYRVGKWNKIYGHLTITQAMMDAIELEVYVSRTWPSKNLIVDKFVMKKVDKDTFGIQTCESMTNLVINGDAETGDTRNWSIKGSGDSGTITMVRGKGGSKYAFRHSDRSKNYFGLSQTLDQSCMDVGSRWTISADFKLYDENGDATTCDPTKLYNVINCPMFFFQSYSRSGGIYQTTPLLNEAITQWAVGEWNQYQATFTMTAEHKAKDETWFFIHKVPAGYSYTVDNIKMVPAS